MYDINYLYYLKNYNQYLNYGFQVLEMKKLNFALYYHIEEFGLLFDQLYFGKYYYQLLVSLHILNYYYFHNFNLRKQVPWYNSEEIKGSPLSGITVAYKLFWF